LLGTAFGSGRVTRVGVTVTFLRMMEAPAASPLPWPEGMGVQRVEAPTVAFYRFLYNTVGADYVWWLRRMMPDAELAELLRRPAVSIHVLYAGGQPAGFFELEWRTARDINLNYFGLMPHAIGAGIGSRFLDHAVAAAWAQTPRMLTVNTCTADHPRALPNYLRAGFQAVRAMDEVWDIPVSLGMKIPAHLKR